MEIKVDIDDLRDIALVGGGGLLTLTGNIIVGGSLIALGLALRAVKKD